MPKNRGKAVLLKEVSFSVEMSTSTTPSPSSLKAMLDEEKQRLREERADRSTSEAGQSWKTALFIGSRAEVRLPNGEVVSLMEALQSR